MATKMTALVLGLVGTAIIAGCTISKNSDSAGDGGGGGGDKATGRISWSDVPTDDNPEVVTTALNLDGIETVNLDLFNFTDDVSVHYSSQLAANEGQLKIYRVYKESASWGALNQSVRDRVLEVGNTGMYQCSIQTDNGRITALKGGCYVRVELTLPTGSEIEVNNLGKLVSKRFKAMSNEEFLATLDRAPFAKERFEAIDSFLSSYTVTGKQPHLSSEIVGKAIHGFSFKEDKLNALRRLQSAVFDRENLAKMIDGEFSYFERNDARAIVGLPSVN